MSCGSCNGFLDGYVSLTQWQVMLWTAVVFTGLVYVTCLSGTLVGITKTSLALLGIQATTTGIARAAHLLEAAPGHYVAGTPSAPSCRAEMR
jgi:hypothetical protein